MNQFYFLVDEMRVYSYYNIGGNMVRNIAIFISIMISSAVLAEPNLEWVKEENGTGNYRDCGYCIGYDKQGNVYVSGQLFNKKTKCDITTIKYSPSGQELWRDAYDGPGHGEDKPYDMKIDNAGNIYVTGRSDGGDATFEDFVVLKYSPNGNRLWSTRYDGPAHDYDCPKAMALDKNGNVYVTGLSWGGDKTWEDIVVVKFDPDGNLVWTERWNGADNDADIPMAITVNDNFDVFVTGLSYNNKTDEDLVTLKYAQPDEVQKEKQRLEEIAARQRQLEEAAQKPKKKGLFGCSSSTK